MSRCLRISEAVAALQAGELVGIPSETVYGLAANALNTRAVARIFAVKGRPLYNPLICHLSTSQSVWKYAQATALHHKLAQHFWPGPLTMLLKRRHNDRIPDIVHAALPETAFRVPQHELTLKLLRACAFPLAAPSANRSGYRSPTTAQMVLDDLGPYIAGVLDGGACAVGLESTVIRVGPDATLEILRPGGLTLESLGKVHANIASLPLQNSLHPKNACNNSNSEVNIRTRKPLAPGNSAQHYRPAKPLLLCENTNLPDYWWRAAAFHAALRDLGRLGPQDCCYFMFGSENVPHDLGHCVNIAPHANLQEAARKLFQLWEELTKLAHIKLFVMHKFPSHDLGWALNDRLQRAASATLQL